MAEHSCEAADAQASAALLTAERQRGQPATWLEQGCSCLPPCAAIRWPSWSRRGAREERVDADEVPVEVQLPALPALDVGFVHVQLQELASSLGSLVCPPPQRELRACACESPWNPAGMLSLRDYIDGVLGLPWDSDNGFILTYDLTEVGGIGTAQLEVMEDILSWVDEQPRRDLWRQHCLCCRVVLPEDSYLGIVRTLLVGLAYVFPPSCDAYLVTSSSAPLQAGDLIYQASAVPRPAAPTVTSCTPTEGERLAQPQGDSEQDSIRTAAHGQPSSIHVGFAEIQGGLGASGLGDVRILACDDAIPQEDSIDRMLHFVDVFTKSPACEAGFSMTYDLRQLRIPSMSIVTRLAEWGGEPERRELWETKNKVCKIVMGPGIKFSIAKGILASFFLVLPPVCTTYLLTDPDEDEANACVFQGVQGFKYNSASSS